MSIGISLSPPSTDISVNLLSSLLGPKWWLLATGQAPSGAGSILGTMFSVFDIALLMYVSALLVYQATVGGMATAHEGTPLGRRYHSIWAPIRGPAAFAMLFPLPWAKGLALIQCIALLAVYWGIGVADDVWNAFVQEIPKMSGAIMPSQSSIRRDNDFVEKLAILATVQSYVVNREGVSLTPTWVWRGNVNSGTWIDTVKLGKGGGAAAAKATGSSANAITSKQFIAGMGAIEVPCSINMNKKGVTTPSGFWSSLGDDVNDAFNYVLNAASTVVPGASLVVEHAQDNPICVAEKTAVDNVMYGSNGKNGMRAIANQIVEQNAQNNAKPVKPSQIAALVKVYAKEQESLYNQLNHDRGAALKAQIQNFAKESESLGWASSSFYYWTLNNINASAQASEAMLHPKVIMPNLQYIGMGTGNYIEPTLKAAFAVINHYESSNDYLSAATMAAKAGGPSGKSSYFGGEVLGIVSSLDSGNPLANMMSAGHGIITAGEKLAAGGGAVAVAANTVRVAAPVVGGIAGFFLGDGAGAEPGEIGGAAVGSFAAKAMASPLARMAASAASTLGKLVLPIGLGLLVEGAIIAYVIPAIPGAIMTIAVIGWLFLVMELMVAAPLWAAAHAYAEGEGFAPQQAMYGYGAAIGIVMRPVLLVFGFVFMFFLIFIVGHFVGGAMSVYMSGMNGFDVGPVGAVSIFAVIIGTIWGSIKFLMGLITNLADQVPQWIGGRGQHLGEKETAIQGAESGSNKAKGVAVAAYGVGRSLASDVARKREKEAERKAANSRKVDSPTESTTNENTNASNISGGDTTGKGEGGDAGGGGGSGNGGGGGMNSGSIGAGYQKGYRAGQKARQKVNQKAGQLRDLVTGRKPGQPQQPAEQPSPQSSTPDSDSGDAGGKTGGEEDKRPSDD